MEKYVFLNNDNRIMGMQDCILFPDENLENDKYNFPDDFDFSVLQNYKIIDGELVHDPLPINYIEGPTVTPGDYFEWDDDNTRIVRKGNVYTVYINGRITHTLANGYVTRILVLWNCNLPQKGLFYTMTNVSRRLILLEVGTDGRTGIVTLTNSSGGTLPAGATVEFMFTYVTENESIESVND